jgi:hypothetical protein
LSATAVIARVSERCISEPRTDRTIELGIETATEPKVLLEALAFVEVVADDRSVESERCELEVHGDDLPALFAACLDELACCGDAGVVPGGRANSS